MTPDQYLAASFAAFSVGLVSLAVYVTAKVSAKADEGEYWIKYTWRNRPVFVAACHVVNVANNVDKPDTLALQTVNCIGHDFIGITNPAEIDAALAALGLTREEVFTTKA